VLLQPMTCQCLLSRPLTLKRRTTEIFQELESNGQRLAMCSFAHEVRNAKPSPSPTPCPATPLQSLRVCQMQCTAAGCSSCELPSSRLCVTRPLGSPTPWEGGSRGASAATSAAAASSAVEASLDPDGAPTPAEQVGRIFVEFEDAEAAAVCARLMDGRFFDGRRVTASFYPRRRLALWSRVRPRYVEDKASLLQAQAQRLPQLSVRDRLTRTTQSGTRTQMKSLAPQRQDVLI